MWLKINTIDDAIMIGVEEGGLYKLKGHSDLELVNNTMNISELWHQILAHLNYKELLIVSKMDTGIQNQMME